MLFYFISPLVPAQSSCSDVFVLSAYICCQNFSENQQVNLFPLRIEATGLGVWVLLSYLMMLMSAAMTRKEGHCENTGESVGEGFFLGTASCCLLKWSHSHRASHSCDTDQISALIRGSSWSPEHLIVYSVEREALVCSFISFPVLPSWLLSFVSSHHCLTLFRSVLFLLPVVTYLCSLCSVWCLSGLQVGGRYMLCKPTMSFHSTQSLSLQFHCLRSFPSYYVLFPSFSVPLSFFFFFSTTR